MIEWLKQNWRPVTGVIALIGLRLLASYAPADQSTREMVIAICNLLDLFGVVAVPAFARIERDK